MNPVHDYIILRLIIGAPLVLASCVLYAVGRWRVFRKMGLRGWQGIVPVYSDLLLFRRLWRVRMLWALWALVAVYCAAVAACFVLAFANAFSENNPYLMPALLVMLLLFLLLDGAGALSLVLLFKLNNRLARAFGKSAAFAVGLTFLPPFFWLALGCGNAVFHVDASN